jgi:tetratricopeptide (TPR) repeat protein
MKKPKSGRILHSTIQLQPLPDFNEAADSRDLEIGMAKSKSQGAMPGIHGAAPPPSSAKKEKKKKNLAASSSQSESIVRVSPKIACKEDVWSIWYAAEKGKTSRMAVILERESTVVDAEKDGHTPLQLASRGGHAAVTELLLDHSANPNKVEEGGGMTALHLAAGWGTKDTVIALLRGGADKTIPAVGTDGSPTPVQLAITMGKVDNQCALDAWQHIGSTHAERLLWKGEVHRTQSNTTRQNEAMSHGDADVLSQLNLLARKQKLKSAIKSIQALVPISQDNQESVDSISTEANHSIKQLPTLTKLVHLHRTAGRLNEAIQAQSQIVTITKSHYGVSHVETAGALNNYAQLLHGLKQYKKALGTLRESSRIIDAVNSSGENGQEQYLEMQSVCLENIILSAQAAAKASKHILEVADIYTNAEPIVQRLLQVEEKLRGAENMRLVRVLMLMGKHYMSQAKYQKAEPPLVRAHKITVANLGTAHIQTAQALDKLGEMHFKAKHFDEAETMFKASLDVLLFLEDPRQHSLPNPFGEMEGKLDAEVQSAQKQSDGGVGGSAAVAGQQETQRPRYVDDGLKPFCYSYSPDIMRTQNNLAMVTIARVKHEKEAVKQAAIAKKRQAQLRQEAKHAESLHLKPIQCKTRKR